ncbi:MAG: small subunit ribosomal protein S17, partial [Chloroflexi bacterium]
MSFESRKTKIGRVVTDGMDKTVVVAVDRRRRHPLYKKSIGVRKKYVVHDA